MSSSLSSRLSTLFLFCCCFLMVSACGQTQTSTGGSTPTTSATPTTVSSARAIDYYGKEIVIPADAPKRIVSLAPSESETLAALGLESKVVGVDFNTNYPSSLAGKEKVSDASGKYNVEKIVSLKPDLVLGYGGLTKTYDSQFQSLGLRVVDLPQVNFTQLLPQIQLVGRLTSTTEAANKITQDLQQQITQVKTTVAGAPTPKVLLEIDYSTPGKPFVFGGGSFGDELAVDAGSTNVFHDNTTNAGYPQVTDEAVIKDNPNYVLLTEDPAYGGDPKAVYKRANWNTITAVKDHKVYHLNVDIMQRPGPRLVQGLRCVAQIIHPDKFSGSLPAYCSASV